MSWHPELTHFIWITRLNSIVLAKNQWPERDREKKRRVRVGLRENKRTLQLSAFGIFGFTIRSSVSGHHTPTKLNYKNLTGKRTKRQNDKAIKKIALNIHIYFIFHLSNGGKKQQQQKKRKRNINLCACERKGTNRQNKEEKVTEWKKRVVVVSEFIGSSETRVAVCTRQFDDDDDDATTTTKAVLEIIHCNLYYYFSSYILNNQRIFVF